MLTNGSIKITKIRPDPIEPEPIDEEPEDFLMASVEDEIATLIGADSALVEIELMFRAMHRRGYIDHDDFKRINKRFDQVYKALANDLVASKSARNGRR